MLRNSSDNLASRRKWTNIQHGSLWAKNAYVKVTWSTWLLVFKPVVPGNLALCSVFYELVETTDNIEQFSKLECSKWPGQAMAGEVTFVPVSALTFVTARIFHCLYGNLHGWSEYANDLKNKVNWGSSAAVYEKTAQARPGNRKF